MKRSLFVFLSLLLLVSLPLQASSRIDSLRVWPAPDHTRLVFDLSGPVQHRVFMLDNPSRLVIDISNARLNTQFSNSGLESTPISRIRSAVRNQNDLRVVLDLSRNVQPRSFLLRPNEQYGHRLVVDLVMPEQARVQQAPPRETLPREQRRIIVAIDPGHGGEDPGAIGPGGTREKDVVWAISRELARQIDADPAFEAVLTRTGDYYIGLRQRVEVARKARADLFLSIHADAYRSPQPRGSSVYVLSQRGASSESARWLADSENRADLIGGVEGVLTLGDKDETLAGVLVDLSMTATLSESLKAGSRVLRNMGQINRLHKRDVEQAGFLVLKSPDMPSMLIEAGFISNPQEEQRLRDRAYQRQMATQIASAIKDYFRDNPPPNTVLASQNNGSETRYVIQRGDTLSEIARRNGVDIGELRKANNLNNDVIRVGQTLRIPSS
ncbi:N-acetylmuramoyl-L-alanine amidase [Marinospirillum alkaliphilum]|uniref:N-acetylmuramoyl-L-alanine amidase AmiC n=1 Tax=Marinospirillum alkaliphilum DSM 21637 TaxID=1122209 RepID=A0A1K1W2T3_9GAMM|nr:N-acetylmuramoyl-L-alanine amidase [Marinospirillum alkaliphilum]SFX31236.1 N-acetylmuramoyl-L-alanine amidase [Marinospirillum alkaliphilum DSM 21637]